MRRLSRVTTSGRFIPEIDGLRFIAIAGVVATHLNGMLYALAAHPIPAWMAALVQRGGYGVQLFFTISGFILALPFAQQHLLSAKPVRLRPYFLRRVTRLEPPYVISLLMTFFFAVLITHKLSWAANGLHLLASTFYLHNIVYAHSSFISTVAWSLEIEIQFYCLVPLLTLLFTIRQKIYRRASIAAIMLLCGLAQNTFLHSPRITLTLAYHLQYFLAGFLLCDFFLTDWHETPKRSFKWDIIFVVSAIALFVAASWRPLMNLAFPFATLALYSATFRSVIFNKILRNPLTTIPGGMCYTIYLFHSQIITTFDRVLKPVASGFPAPLYCGIQAILSVIAVFLCCAAFFVVVEKPCMDPRWPSKLYDRVRSIASSLAAPQKTSIANETVDQ